MSDTPNTYEEPAQIDPNEETFDLQALLRSAPDPVLMPGAERIKNNVYDDEREVGEGGETERGEHVEDEGFKTLKPQ